MNYWWVNQTDNWQDEFENGYLYAGENGHPWRKSILDVRKDDLVICSHDKGEKRKIYALGVISGNPSGMIVPRRLTRTVETDKTRQERWLRGWEAFIDYDELKHPVLWAPIRRDLQQGKFTAKHFTQKSAGVQGYLFPVPSDTAGEILRRVNREQPPEARIAVVEASQPEMVATAVAAEIMVRVGHQRWSVEVKRMWGDRCCATGFNVRSLLASIAHCSLERG